MLPLVLLVLAMPLESTAQEEHALNAFQIRSSHNSFQRDNLLFDQESITDQLDRYNIWWLEFDVKWTTLDGGRFHVFHDCAEPVGNADLVDLLLEVNRSKRRSTGLTFLHFDTNEQSVDCALFPFITKKPAGWQEMLADLLESIFGDSMYDQNDLNRDNPTEAVLKVWPSPQELLRRGKHIIPIVGSGAARSERRTFAQSVVIANTSNPASIDLPNFPVNPVTMFTRVFPSINCDNGNGNVELGLQRGFNIASTNCTADFREAIDPRIHPPLPMYVSSSSGTSSGARGTWLAPIKHSTPSRALSLALARVRAFETTTGKRSTITMAIDSGDYQMTFVSGGNYTITRAVTLTNQGAAVSGDITLR